MSWLTALFTIGLTDLMGRNSLMRLHSVLTAQTAVMTIILASFLCRAMMMTRHHPLCMPILYGRILSHSHQTRFSNVANKSADARWRVEGKPELLFLPWLHSVQALLQRTGGRSGFSHRIWILYLQCSQEVPLCNQEPARTLDIDSPALQIVLFQCPIPFQFECTL